MRLERRLPLRGQVCAKIGEKVAPDSVVAHTELPGRVEMINIAAKLGIDACDVPSHLLCQIGDDIKEGQPLAESRGIFGLFNRILPATISGKLESVSEISGQAVLRAPAQRVEVRAHVEGRVAEILNDEGVVIETAGVLIQGIFGIGGESSGKLRCLAPSPNYELQPQDLQEEHRGCVVSGGALVSCAVLKRAVELGVHGIVAGGINDGDLREFMGYDLGVAVTGSEDLGITLIVTEGFGSIAMAQRTFDLLRRHEGELASISGATQIRAGVIRPEIIIAAHNDAQVSAPPELSFNLGSPVRLIREPHFGELAEIVGLPSELTEIPTGAKVRVAQVRLRDGATMLIPRANLELIAE